MQGCCAANKKYKIFNDHFSSSYHRFLQVCKRLGFSMTGTGWLVLNKPKYVSAFHNSTITHVCNKNPQNKLAIQAPNLHSTMQHWWTSCDCLSGMATNSLIEKFPRKSSILVKTGVFKVWGRVPSGEPGVSWCYEALPLLRSRIFLSNKDVWKTSCDAMFDEERKRWKDTWRQEDGYLAVGATEAGKE